MGQPTPRMLKCTQLAVEGIPYLSWTAPIFCCPFCDKRETQKTTTSEQSTQEVFYSGTIFHMDVGFIRGHSNLTSVVNDGATPTTTTITSHDGCSTYLLIIDVAIRYIWVFCPKSKHPHIKSLIDSYTNMAESKAL